MGESGKANELMSFVRTEILCTNEFDSEKAEKLEKLIKKFVKLEGRNTGIGVVEARNIQEWKRVIEIYQKVAETVFLLEKKIPNCPATISNYFDLKTVEIFLTGLIIKGSKIFKGIENGNKMKAIINREQFEKGKEDIREPDSEKGKKELGKGSYFQECHYNILQKFLNNSIPFLRNNSLNQEAEIDLPQDDKIKKEFLSQGEITLWYTIYYFAVNEIEKEKQQNKDETQYKGGKYEKIKEEIEKLIEGYKQHTKELAKQRGGR